MQHRYTGDIGDYLKLALLRAIPAGRRLAVCWWLHPDEGHNDDGRHTGYLDQPGRWRDVDQELFEKLADIVRSGQRSVHKLEASTLDRTVKFHSDPVPIGPGRGKAREPWFRRLVHTVEGSDVIFLDPDNGIDLHLDALRRCSAKHTTIPEINSLSEGGQTLVIYHHQTRAKGGHDTEIARIQLTLESLGRGRVTAIRARPFSPRVFFVVGPDIQTHECLEEFSKQFPEFFQVYEGNTDRLTRPTNLLAWQSRIITLYPEMFPGPLGVSIAGRALADGTWSCTPIQLRDFATDKHRTVDDTPAGGGAGMVLRADIVAAAVDHALAAQPDAPILAMTPRGKPITQARIRELAAGPGVTILCGRFEGFDERLFEARPQIEQVSMGDIILSGGEPAALMLLDACIRLLPGVMGAPSSGVEESFENGLLEYPHYTRPVEWEGCTIPEVLRSGDHAKIAAWRKHQAEVDTRLRRPDLWERHEGARAQPASGARRKNKDQMGHEPHPDDRSGTDR